MALFIAGSIGLFGFVASGWYFGITYLKDKIINNNMIKNDFIMIDHRDELSSTCGEFDMFYLSDDDTTEPILFDDPLPIGIMHHSYESITSSVNPSKVST